MHDVFAGDFVDLINFESHVIEKQTLHYETIGLLLIPVDNIGYADDAVLMAERFNDCRNCPEIVGINIFYGVKVNINKTEFLCCHQMWPVGHKKSIQV